MAVANAQAVAAPTSAAASALTHGAGVARGKSERNHASRSEAAVSKTAATAASLVVSAAIDQRRARRLLQEAQLRLGLAQNALLSFQQRAPRYAVIWRSHVERLAAVAAAAAAAGSCTAAATAPAPAAVVAAASANTPIAVSSQLGHSVSPPPPMTHVVAAAAVSTTNSGDDAQRVLPMPLDASANGDGDGGNRGIEGDGDGTVDADNGRVPDCVIAEIARAVGLADDTQGGAKLPPHTDGSGTVAARGAGDARAAGSDDEYRAPVLWCAVAEACREHAAWPSDHERRAMALADDASRWSLGQHHAAACRAVAAEFAAEFEGAPPPVTKTDHNTCSECGRPLRMVVSGSALVCGPCRLTRSHMDTTTAAMSYGDDVDMAAAQPKKGGHLDVKLRNFQGRSSKHIDPQVMLQIMQWLLARGFTSNDDVTWKTVRLALKALEKASPKRGLYRRYYDHSMRISCLITRKAPPSMTPEQERITRAMFTAMRDPFDKWVMELAPDRVTGFVSYNYSLHKVFQLRGWHEFLAYFPLVGDIRKLRLQEAIWSGICWDMDWDFVSSTAPEDAPPVHLFGGSTPIAQILKEWLAGRELDDIRAAAERAAHGDERDQLLFAATALLA
jgi:hypothetical protein